MDKYFMCTQAAKAAGIKKDKGKKKPQKGDEDFDSDDEVHCDTLQHTATHCNTLQYTATHCNTLQQRYFSIKRVMRTSTLTTRYTATHCDTLQHTATHCNTLQQRYFSIKSDEDLDSDDEAHCDTLRHTATHCITLQRTATHLNSATFPSKVMRTWDSDDEVMTLSNV